MTLIGVEPERSYEEVARELGVSRVRVMQIEQKALKKLRALCGVDPEIDQQHKVVRRHV